MELSQIINDLKQDENVKKIVKELSISESDFEKYLLPIMSYSSSCKICSKCMGLDSCIQTTKGYKVILKNENDRIEVSSVKCSKLSNLEEISVPHLFTSGYNFNLLSNQELFVTKERSRALTLTKNFLNGYLNNIPSKGIYLYGSHGSGKTFLMAYIAKELSKHGKDVLFMYYPELVRQLKSKLATGDLEVAMDELKTVDVLMLDDFGAEAQSSFVRDELLSTILQERMNNNLPVFMTSNLDDDCLIEHLSESKDKTDILKATRIRERMMALMDFVELSGSNYRK